MVKIGKIVNTKGLKGEVKVLSNSDFKDIRFKVNNKLYIKKNSEFLEITISKWYTQKNFDILKLKEYNFIDEAKDIISYDIYGEQLEDDVLEEGEFFFDELLNYNVYENEKLIGVVIEVFDQANKTYLKIKTSDKNILLPCVDEFIKDVNKNKNTIEIESIPGLLDD